MRQRCPTRIPACFRKVVPTVVEVPHVTGKVEARLLLQPTFTDYRSHAGRTTDWVVLGPTHAGCAGKLTGTAGGWYRLEVRGAGGDAPASWKPAPDTTLPERIDLPRIDRLGRART